MLNVDGAIPLNFARSIHLLLLVDAELSGAHVDQEEETAAVGC